MIMIKPYFFALLSLIVLLPFVSAQYFGSGFWYGTEQAIDSIVMNLEPFFRALLGGNDWTGYLLFEKVLLFILISIIVEYQVLFIAIAGVLPFMIYWYFLESIDKGLVRKVAWVFYAAIYFGLWATTTLETYSEVYLWSAIAALIYAFVFDTMVIQWLKTQEMKKQFSRHSWNQIADINERISKINKQIAEGHMPVAQGNLQINELIEHRKLLAQGKNLI